VEMAQTDPTLRGHCPRTNSTAARASDAVMSGRASRTALTASSVCVRWSRPLARASSRVRRMKHSRHSSAKSPRTCTSDKHARPARSS
jgi:hypothetical protein